MYVGLERVRPSRLRSARCSEIFKAEYLDTEGNSVPEHSEADRIQNVHETVARRDIKIPSAAMRLDRVR